MKLLVSACLLGAGCRYDGGHNQLPQLKELLKTHTCIPICPEQMGGLPTPRPPAERQGSRVVTRDGEDVTEAFLRGTAEVLRLADLYRCKAALLKERSPSCGCGQIYDGTFSKTLVEGDGMAAQMLKKHGLTVYGESQIGELVNTRPFFYSISKRQTGRPRMGLPAFFFRRVSPWAGQGSSLGGKFLPVEHCPHQGVPHILQLQGEKGDVLGEQV